MRAASAPTEALTPTAFQQRVLAAPADVNLLLGGGRGGGKSVALLFLALQHMEMFRDQASVLFIRQRHSAVADFLSTARRLFAQLYGSRPRFNSNSRQWNGLPTGSRFEVNQLDSITEFPQKFQGRSYSLVLWDEAGEAFDSALFAMMLSCLRAPKGVSCRVALAANPGGASHSVLAERFVFRAEPWSIFRDELSGTSWLNAPSTLQDNDAMDREPYERLFAGMQAVDPELARAWRYGDWSVVRGSFFSGCLSTEKVAIPSDLFKPGFVEAARFPPDGDPLLYGAQAWSVFLAIDWGSSSPCYCGLFARSPGALAGDYYFARGSLVLIDEVPLVDPSDLSKGLGMMTPDAAGRFSALADKWGVPARGIADDAIWAKHGSAEGSIAEELSRHGLDLEPARKGSRLLGWARMREMLANCGEVDRPGLYVSRRCAYWWQTVPSLPRDARQADDVDTRAVDHAADATRYAIVSDGQHVGSSFEVHV